jgi:hypothetical protein
MFRSLRRNLAAREFGPVLRPQFPESLASVSGEQVIRLDAENLGEREQLEVSNPSILVFQPIHGFAARNPAQQLKAHSEAILGPSLSRPEVSNLRADHVKRYALLSSDSKDIPIGVKCFGRFTAIRKSSCYGS